MAGDAPAGAGDDGPPTSSSPGARSGRAFRVIAGALLLAGLLAAIAAVRAPPGRVQELLVSIAGVGVLGGVLTYWIRPSATVDTDPAQRVYATLAANTSALREDLGAADRTVYAPAAQSVDGFAPVVVLCLPADAGVPPAGERRPVLDTGVASGEDVSEIVTLHPTGAALLDAIEDVATRSLPEEPLELADHLSTAAVASLELAAAIEPAVDGRAGTASFTVRSPSFWPPEDEHSAPTFDHPVPSVLATGLALGLDRPVTASTSVHGPAELRVTCEWSVDPGDGPG